MISDPGIYTDLQSLSQLRTQARANSPEAVRAVARQFEGLLMQMMLKSMRDASLGDGLMDNEQTELYQSMFDQQISLTLSRGRGMGLAELLVKQLGGAAGAQVTKGAQDSQKNAAFSFPAPQMALPQVAASVQRPVFDSPEEFVKALWPLAEHTGKTLGVPPQAILAQAALETGWGQAIMQHADGRSTHNLFGIKADNRWEGERITMPTLEYTQGKASRRNEPFRSYDSYAASFADYANFLRSNPRYGQALLSGHNPLQFTQALRDAGYATDPDYNIKINNIINSPAISSRLNLLPGMPLT